MEDSRKNLHTDDTVYRVKTATFLNEKRSSTRVELKKKRNDIRSRKESPHTNMWLSLLVRDGKYLLECFSLPVD